MNIKYVRVIKIWLIWYILGVSCIKMILNFFVIVLSENDLNAYKTDTTVDFVNILLWMMKWKCFYKQNNSVTCQQRQK